MPVEVTVTGIDEATQKYVAVGRQLPLVVARALNRAIAGARTETRRTLMAQTGLRGKDITPALSVARATRTNLAAALRARERRPPLIAYVGARGFRSGKGIAGQAYKLGSVPAGAFFAQMPSGHRGIYKRSGRFGRRGKPYLERIEQLLGPPISGVIVQLAIFEAIRGKAQALFEQRLAHESERLLATARVDGDEHG